MAWVIATLAAVLLIASLAVSGSWHSRSFRKIEYANGDVQNIKAALGVFYSRKGFYPPNDSVGLARLVPEIFERTPVDPWGNPYLYLLDGGHPIVSTYGRDGRPGGSGEDADITSEDSR